MSRPALRHGGASRRRAALPLIAALVAGLVLVVPGCGSAETSSSGGDQRELTVLAASSLTEAFTQLGDRFTAAHPDVKVTFDFAGSSDLVAQLQQGAPADVLATADTTSMDKVASLTGAPQAFAGNKLIIAIEPGNPKHIDELADLAATDLKVVLAAPEVPAGKYAQQALAKAGVTVRPVSLEESVKGVVTKVSLGEADAGIVYVTDVDAAAGKIEGVPIPDDENVLATYPIATLDGSGDPEDARAFVDLVLSAEGQKVLADHEFLPSP
jgi:molybdate transport system substrate-binding protein